MKIKEAKDISIIDEIRAIKTKIATEHGFDVSRIIAGARKRQDSSERRIIRRPDAKPDPNAAK